MTLNEIAYNLLNLVRGGRSNHDEHISLDQIKFNIKHYRAMFIRRDFAKNGFTSRHIEHDLGCFGQLPRSHINFYLFLTVEGPVQNKYKTMTLAISISGT